jgi:hypothetical protein
VKRSLLPSSVLCSLLLAAGVLSSRASFAADDKPNDDKGKDTKSEADKPKGDDDKPAEPAPATGTDAAASTSATASVDTSAGATAELTGAATADAPGPSLDHPAFTAPGAKRCSATPIRQGDHPEYVDRSCYTTQFGTKDIYLYGGLELDVGYAKYTYKDDELQPYEDFNDLRGRFVVGPMLHHDFGQSGFWVAATGQLVAWVRDRAGSQYQINADDVYGQVGGPLGKGQWDFQVGRFMTWRVYHKGLGFDLYTLEDNGANLPQTSVALGTAQYAVHTYEVNYIYYRQGNLPYGNEEIAGKMALHYYPAPFLGFELTGVYGQAGGGKKNSLGGRLAADFHKNLGPVGLRASVGAEDRWETLAQPKFNNVNPDPAGPPDIKECPDCDMRDNKGVGGSGIVTFSIVELGGGLAKGWDLAHKISSASVGAERDLAHSGVRTTFGGYLQLDPGKLLFKRSLIIGAGLQHTELVMKTNDYQTHMQGAAYIAFPLGFNDAVLKLVVSRAEAENFLRSSADGAPLTFNKAESAMTAGRLRFAYYF